MKNAEMSDKNPPKCGQSPKQAPISSDRAVLGKMLFSSRELDDIKKVAEDTCNRG